MNALSTETLWNGLKAADFIAADVALARHLRDFEGETNNWILLAAALAMQASREGHAYLDINGEQTIARGSVAAREPWPTLEEWKEMLEASGCVAVNAPGAIEVGLDLRASRVQDRSPGRRSLPDQVAPLVFDEPGSLYLHRYYQHEIGLARRIKELAGRSVSLAISAPDPKLDPLQAEAIQGALTHPFYLITGGPGTGKTTTVLRYLAASLEQWSGQAPPRIALAAPTGKAAARLGESIERGLERLDCAAAVKRSIAAVPCLTIHRLLGSIPYRSGFRRDRKNPLDLDLLVIDEASMIDLPLMRRLCDAVPENCRVTFLGDAHQLSSVDVGSVLADVQEAMDAPDSPLAGMRTTLLTTYRFSGDSAIQGLCEAVKAGDRSRFFETLDSAGTSECSLHGIEQEALASLAAKGFAKLADAATPEEAVARLGDFAVLCPIRFSPLGSDAVNQAVSRRLQRSRPAGFCQPVMVLENNYDLELFNGDIGALMPADGGERFAYFGRGGGKVVRVPESQLPRSAPAWAMTIHKSQGSEFDAVAIAVGEASSGVASRELLYTALSRAKRTAHLFAERETLGRMIERQATRATGLAGRICGR